MSGAAPDLLVANAASHVAAAHAAGYESEMVPSVIEIERARTETTRRAVLLVNPIRLLGGDRLFPLAEARPDIPFVIQESGLMSDDERREVHRLAASYANVEVREFASDPAAVFADAGVLLVPHRVDNRPRVVLEAQANGIPVIASNYPGLVESIGAGGVTVADTDDPTPWLAALGALWDDADGYARVSELARARGA